MEGDPSCNVFEQFEIARRSVSVAPARPTTVEPAVKVESVATNTPLVLTHHPNAPISTLKDILAVQRPPKKFRVRARVVDYSPRDLREWVRGYCEECQTLYECLDNPVDD